MLYKKFDDTEKNEFIFDALIYNDDIDIKDVALLEAFLKKNGYIPSKYISLFLNYVTYYARSSVLLPFDDALTSSYKNKCSLSASVNDKFLEKMGLERIVFNIGDIFGTDKIHQLCMVNIPTMLNGKIVKKPFILDPTFRQFTLKEENRFERYFEEERYGVRRATPHPGYFFNLDETGKKLANYIIRYGYFEANLENLKRYFDSFYFYLKRKEEYTDARKVGKEYVSSISGMEYYKRILSNKLDLIMVGNIDVKTPLEMINEERKKIKNKIKYFFTKNDDFKGNLDLESTIKNKRV